jgi:adenine-specific DNA-methyltransferase
VAERLRRLLAGADSDPALEFAEDLEEGDELVLADADEAEAPDTGRITLELERVESFVARLGALETDSKASALLDTVRVQTEAAERGEGSGKLVIFTESLSTQDYLRELLVSSGVLLDEDITLFRGHNVSPRATQALEKWQLAVGQKLGKAERASRDVAVRLALVFEFRHYSRVFISTEAGAKGLNLQFCDTLINYDLPWNPQRIEQRIGRCHRYGQERDVTVINFLAKDNAAQRLTFEILSRKLELFGAVLDASDHVLYEPKRGAYGVALAALSSGFAAELRRIYEGARSMAQIEGELSRLNASLEAQKVEIEATHERTAGLIASRFDAAVRLAFRHIADELPGHLRELDRDLELFLCDYLDSENVRYHRAEVRWGTSVAIEPSAALPEPFQEGVRLAFGGSLPIEAGEPLHVGHPLVRAAAEAAREATRDVFRIRIGANANDPELRALCGRRGRLRVVKLRYPGFEPVDRLLPVVVLEGGGAVDPETGSRLLSGPIEAIAELESQVSDSELEEAVEEALFLDEREVSALEHGLFERAIGQLERFIEDRVLILKRSREDVMRRIHGGRKERAAASGSDARTRAEALLERSQRELEALDVELGRLQSRDDAGYQRWRKHAHDRRYAPPEREPVVEAEFVIG